MMTIEEAIKHCEEVAKELQEVDMAELDLMYAGDTECIDEHKDRCLACANDHKQLAEWLTDYKRLKEQEPSEDCISRAEAIKGLGEQPLVWTDSNSEIQQLLDWREHKEMLERLPSVGQKVGHWIVEIWNNREHHTCSECQHVVDYEPCYHYCPYCGAKLSEVEE